MSRGQGRSEIVVALIDGPVFLDHPAFSRSHIREMSPALKAACARVESQACSHGTFVAAILSARRGSPAPAICPGCTLLLRPVFSEQVPLEDPMPRATPEDLAEAIDEAVGAGANIINLSAAVAPSGPLRERRLEQSLDNAMRRGVLVVTAAGNQGTVGSSAITRHPWVVPVIGCDPQGRPTRESNLGRSIGRGGLSAPGENITSLSSDGRPGIFHGTSAAAPFVSGAAALLWSEFPKASAARIKGALTQAGGRAGRSIVPPLLDAWGAFLSLSLN
jgi:subtilisin family serine protease